MWSTLVPHYLLHVLDVDGDNHYAEIDSLPNYTTYSSTAQRYENAVAKKTPKDAKDPTDKNIMIPDLLSKIRLLERDSRRGFTEEFRVLNIFCMFLLLIMLLFHKDNIYKLLLFTSMFNSQFHSSQHWTTVQPHMDSRNMTVFKTELQPLCHVCYESPSSFPSQSHTAHGLSVFSVTKEPKRS